jgi:heat shock protein HtpX
MAGFAFMFGRSNDDDDGNPVASILLIVLAPIIALLVQLAVSRTREYGADASGAQLVGSGRGLASALAKLNGWAQRVPMHSADVATSHMYIVQPALGIGSSMAALFQTHPPVEERIRRLQETR